ncbi:Sulfotransferase family protein [Desulforhopalus singaporensis]|uniref:Sulfotransferase family protein n=2 Tax=Desulforhopalus singaporensis TaxID=91360 RepID=A0A1H0VA52_9BACT|nr:Sulfotransferase family protein [Desulforhopalus singaporensis]
MVADRTNLFGYDRTHNVYLQHASAALTRELAGKKVFRDYYTFTIVRNPFTRLVSVYYYGFERHQKQYGSFENYILALPEILQNKSLFKGSHHIPQTYYTHIEGCPACDHIAYFEDLPKSLDPVRQRLHIDAPLKKLNTVYNPLRPDKPPEKIYSQAMIDTVNHVFQDDFKLLGYSQNPKRVAPLFEYIPSSSLRA